MSSRLKPCEEGTHAWGGSALHTEWLERRRHDATAGPACGEVRWQQRAERGYGAKEQRQEKHSEEGGGEEKERTRGTK